MGQKGSDARLTHPHNALFRLSPDQNAGMPAPVVGSWAGVSTTVYTAIFAKWVYCRK